jgi:hypothetical protein
VYLCCAIYVSTYGTMEFMCIYVVLYMYQLMELWNLCVSLCCVIVLRCILKSQTSQNTCKLQITLTCHQNIPNAQISSTYCTRCAYRSFKYITPDVLTYCINFKQNKNHIEISIQNARCTYILHKFQAR